LITVSELNGVLHEPHLKIIGLNVQKGKKYTYSVYMKADRPCRALFNIRRFRAEIFYGDTPQILLGTGWKEYSYTIEAPESNTFVVMVRNAKTLQGDHCLKSAMNRHIVLSGQ